MPVRFRFFHSGPMIREERIRVAGAARRMGIHKLQRHINMNSKRTSKSNQPPPAGRQDPIEDIAVRSLRALKKKFVVLAGDQILPWQAWLAIGIAVGLVGGTVAVTNRSGEVGRTRAAAVGQEPALLVSGVVFAPDGRRELIRPQLAGGTPEEIFAAMGKNPLRYLAPDQQAAISPHLKRFAVIPKQDLSPQEASALERKIQSRGGKEVRAVKSAKRGTLSFQIENQARAESLKREPEVEAVLEDRLIMLAQAPGGGGGGGPDVPSIPETPDERAPVTVGVVDTGVDRLPGGRGSLDGAKNYSPGPETTRFLTFFQPWHTSRSFPIRVPDGGGWLNVVVSFPYFFGFNPSPSDLDLVLRDASGRVVARAETAGNVPQSERVEVNAPASAGGSIWTAEVMAKKNTPRLLTEYSDIFQTDYWWPAFTPQAEAGLFPLSLDAVLSEEVHEQPPGALPSRTGTWKKGSFALHGKRYGVVMSDVHPEQACASFGTDAEGSRQYVFFGYDGASFDLDGDGDFGDLTGVGECVKLPDGSGGYYEPRFLLGGQQYLLNSFYSTYWVFSGTYGGREYADRWELLTALNDRAVGFWTGLGSGPDVYGPRDTTDDFLGHGTHVSGIVKKVSPGARIFNAKVFGNGPGFAFCASSPFNGGWTICAQGILAYESDVVAGIQGAIENGARVINLSLGGYYEPPWRCEDFLLSRFVKDVVTRQGITVVAAAGNSGPGSRTIGFPACAEEVITVGAVGTSPPYGVASYSSRGPSHEGLAKPDLVAIGGDDATLAASYPDHIAFVFPGGVASPESEKVWAFFGMTDRAPGRKIKMSGTSMATPQVAGAAARLLRINPLLTPAQIKAILATTATNLGLPPAVQGAGLLNLKEALKLAKKPPEAPPPPPIRALAPNGGEEWLGIEYLTDTISGNEVYHKDITWTGGSKPDDPYPVDAFLEKFEDGTYVRIGRIFPFGIGSIAWIVGIVGKGECNDDVYACGSVENMQLVAPGTYYVHLIDKKTGIEDRSDAPFTIVAPSLTVLSPNGEEAWPPGSIQEIRWKSNLPETNALVVGLRHLAPNTPTDYPLLSDMPNDGFETIEVPTTLPAGSYLLFIKTKAGETVVHDFSDAPFRIALAAGALSVSIDPSSPSLRLAQAGAEVPILALRLSATGEAVALEQIVFKLSNTEQNSPADIVRISLWDGATKVGEVAATSSDTGLKMYFREMIRVPKDGDKVVVLRADLAKIGINQPGNPGDLVTVDWDQVNLDGKPATYGIGEQSDAVIYASGEDTQSGGVRMFRAFPTLSALPVPSNSLADASQKTLYRFAASAPAGTNGVSLYKFVFNVATTGDDGTANDFSITNLRQYAFVNSSFSGDAYGTNPINSGGLAGGIPEGGGVCSGGPTGLTCSTDFALYFNPANPVSATPEAIHMPSATVIYFELRGDVTGADAGDTATVSLEGDAASSGVCTPEAVDFFPHDDFIWSGNSTTTHSGVQVGGADWANGHLVPGLPADGMSAQVFSL